MAFIRKYVLRTVTKKTLTAVVLSLIALGGRSCLAQEPLSGQEIASADPASHTLGARMYTAAHEATVGIPPAQATDTPATTTDNQWHFAFAPYLWFAGMHGSVGVRGLNVSVKASPGDLLSHADVGLMGTLEAQKGRWIIPVDIMWLALSDDKGLPENEPGIQSITFRAGEFILTPKVGYKLIDKPKLKVDSMVGVRYWHLGERFHFNPTLYNGFTTSQDWADAVGGIRIEMPLSPKASITVVGDGGKGGSLQDYQIAGLLNYKIKQNISLFGGWRYMSVDYFNSRNAFLYNMTVSGVGLGAVFKFK